MIATAGLRTRIEVSKFLRQSRRLFCVADQDAPAQSIYLSRPMMLAFWFVALPVLLIEIGKPEVTRTQEARVLECAREMLGRPWIDWMIPKLCGAVRLQKPPLTYWMSAG